MASSGLRVRLCVLASSSSGNCSVLVVDSSEGASAVLIDAGLSPRRTRNALAAVGAGHARLAGVVLTHLDTDHVHAGWHAALPHDAPLFVHRRQLGRAQRDGLLFHRTIPFDAPFDLPGGLHARPLLVSHDSLGSTALRITHRAAPGSLGYATDLGRATEPLIRHLAGVDVLAIESNYCPRMQMASSRPDALKRRIMSGHGHLSNEQCARAVREIRPGAHVVLLHLSRECNHPDRAAAAHADARYALTVAHDEHPTPWIDVTGAAAPDPARPSVVVSQATLWSERV